MVEQLPQDNIVWLDEPEYLDHEQGIELVEEWYGSIQNWSADTEVLEDYREVLNNPEVYDFDMLHGTDTDSLENILDDGELLPSSELEDSGGEINNCKSVSSTGSPFLANIYATRARPNVERIYEGIENDILGRRLKEHERNLETAKSMIRDAIENSNWCFAGLPLTDTELNEEEKRSCRENREQLYKGALEQLDNTGDLHPVIISYDQENIESPTNSNPVYRNEVGKEHLSEVKSSSVHLDSDTKIFIPKNIREQFKEETDDAILGTLEGLELIHAARNNAQYIEEGSRMDYTTVWEGADRGTHAEKVEYKFDILNPDLF